VPKVQDMSTTETFTDEQLLRLPKDGYKRELVDGKIVVSPAGYRHGLVIVRLSARLAAFVAERDLGDVLDSSTGFRLPSRNLRVPDISFVARGRVPDPPPEGFAYLAPDLVVEVLSPGDSPRQVLDKVGEYLGAGSRLVWVIDPEARRAAAYRSLTDVTQIPEEGALDGGDLLPGFSCRLAAIL
jgi:Uma2 family endonuclease